MSNPGKPREELVNIVENMQSRQSLLDKAQNGSQKALHRKMNHHTIPKRQKRQSRRPPHAINATKTATRANAKAKPVILAFSRPKCFFWNFFRFSIFPKISVEISELQKSFLTVLFQLFPQKPFLKKINTF